ncbi:MAG TPA: molybdenum cofactor guanylyltransferase [Kofleriaceae bacterium]|nr:molybdenum cofactor guanylyltransferase [Kofleriaceae bacterium]
MTASAPTNTHVSALILAGGKATRLGGISKHEIVVEGETIFARQVRVLAPRVAEIIVAGPTIEGYRNVTDVKEGAGPLAGIAAGLAACRTPWLLVVAGDMPHISAELIDALIACVSAPRTGSGTSSQETRDVDAIETIDAVGVRVNGLPEPLLCVLHTRVLPTVEQALAAGRYKASRILTDDGLWVRWLEAERPAVRNINSPEDLRAERGSK